MVGIFVLVGQSPGFESVLRTEGKAESGSHTLLEDRQARLSDEEYGYLRYERIPGLHLVVLFLSYGITVLQTDSLGHSLTMENIDMFTFSTALVIAPLILVDRKSVV